MKRVKYLILAAIILAAAVYFVYVNISLGEIKVIMLDPGHGATDNGCSYAGVNEKDINYDIALRTKDQLEQLDYKVIFTHDDKEYVSPHGRSKLANRKGVDLYISIHQNAAENSDAKGIEAWFSVRNPHSKRLAEAIQASLVDNTQAEDRGVKVTASLVVVRETKMPSVLIECGFLSNPNERESLADENYRQIIAESIAQAVEDFARN
ncbi:MAG: N-acetylmuramoyl-L-alanine amidase [Clostridia bacterium]|nr:N-acetylmuramoyl-L-alanine amidase [Clostridia bacterium]